MKDTQGVLHLKEGFGLRSLAFRVCQPTILQFFPQSEWEQGSTTNHLRDEQVELCHSAPILPQTLPVRPSTASALDVADYRMVPTIALQFSPDYLFLSFLRHVLSRVDSFRPLRHPRQHDHPLGAFCVVDTVVLHGNRLIFTTADWGRGIEDSYVVMVLDTSTNNVMQVFMRGVLLLWKSNAHADDASVLLDFILTSPNTSRRNWEDKAIPYEQTVASSSATFQHTVARY
jgi:hypothetical protein